MGDMDEFQQKLWVDSNRELQEHLEKHAEEFAKKIEESEQARYSLQLQLNRKIAMEADCEDEIENLRTTIAGHQTSIDSIEAQHQRELIDIRKEVALLNAEAETRQLLVTQLEEKRESLEGMLRDTQAELAQRIDAMNETASDELVDLNCELKNLQFAKTQLQGEFEDKRASEQRLQHEMTTLRATAAQHQADMEQTECRATTYFNALEKCREEVQDLRAQMEALRMESHSIKAKGNSLFSEVEDRRVDVEKELISVKAHYSSIKSAHAATRQQLNSLRCRMANLLDMSATARSDQADRLDHQLAVARAEIEKLTIKLNEAERNQGKGQTVDGMKDLLQPFGDKDANDKYSEFVKSMLESKDKKIADLQQDLEGKRFEVLIAEDQVIQTDRKLFTAKQELESSRAQCFKLKVSVDELTLKYEPDSVKVKAKKEYITEKLPMPETSSQKDGLTDAPEDVLHEVIIPNRRKSQYKARMSIANAPMEEKPSDVLRESGDLNQEQKHVMKSLRTKTVCFTEEVKAKDEEMATAVKDGEDGEDGEGGAEGADEGDEPAKKKVPRGKKRYCGSIPVTGENECPTQ